MKTENTHYIKALRFNWLTKHYDKIVSLTTREKFFKSKLVEQSQLEDGFEVLDVGSGTGTLALLIKSSKLKAIVTGVDGDANIISLAQQKARDQNLEISFKKGFAFSRLSCIN